MRIVLLPGIDGSAELRSDFVAALGSGFDVSVVDYASDDVRTSAELEALARGAIPSHEPFVLLGESFGGRAALSLAAQAPANLLGLVLVATFARNPRPALGPLAPLTRFAPFHSRTAIGMGRRLALGSYFSPDAERLIEDIILRQSTKTFAERLVDVSKIDFSHLLPKVSVPVLYMRGRWDWLVPASAGQEIANGARDVRIVEIKGPHALLQTVPEDCAEAVRGFTRNLTT